MMRTTHDDDDDDDDDDEWEEDIIAQSGMIEGTYMWNALHAVMCGDNDST